MEVHLAESVDRNNIQVFQKFANIDTAFAMATATQH